MEPVTHVLAGACLARTGLNRRIKYCTLAMAIGAEFPDIDVLWSIRGPVSGFQHHRGITHTFLGVPFEAAAIVGLFALCHRLRRRRARIGTESARKSAPLVQSPDPGGVRWTGLYGCTILALLSHLLLDYTNNYGVRPFFPFVPKWYAASIVFIFDPLIFLCLLLALLLPWILSLVRKEIGVKRPGAESASAARVAWAVILLLWTVRAVEHQKAVSIANLETVRAPEADAEPDPDLPGSQSSAGQERPPSLLRPRRSLASPDPLSVFRWYVVTDFGSTYRLGTVDTGNGSLTPGRFLVSSPTSPVLETAERSRLGRAYLDWSPLPVVRVGQAGIRSEAGQPAPSGTVVLFTDPRFMGDSPLLQRGSEPPLTGEVVLDTAGRVIAEGMDGRSGH